MAPPFHNEVPQFNKFGFYDLTRDVPIGIFGGGDHRSRPREAVSADYDTDQLTIRTADTDQEVLFIQACGLFPTCFCFKY